MCQHGLQRQKGGKTNFKVGDKQASYPTGIVML